MSERGSQFSHQGHTAHMRKLLAILTQLNLGLFAFRINVNRYPPASGLPVP